MAEESLAPGEGAHVVESLSDSDQGSVGRAGGAPPQPVSSSMLPASWARARPNFLATSTSKDQCEDQCTLSAGCLKMNLLWFLDAGDMENRAPPTGNSFS